MPRATGLKALDEHINILLTCPKCGNGFNRTAAWLREHDNAVCPACEEWFGLRKYQAQVMLAQLVEKTPSTAKGKE